jgi:serine/threonine protein kinase
MAPRALNRGTVVGGDRFVLEAMLGQGSAGSVWLAQDRTSSEKVALKILRGDLRENPRMMRRFRREAMLLMELKHDSIARALAYVLEDDIAFIAMEYVPGAPLSSEMSLRSANALRFDPAEVAAIMGRMFSAVAHAHTNGVIHRDLKPPNVMLYREGPAVGLKVLDFGIAKLLDEDRDDGTTIGRVLGTPRYMAPEQCGGLETDRRTDVFALGVILYELLTLRKAWMDDARGRPVPLHDTQSLSRVDLMERVMSGPRLVPSQHRSGLPGGVDELIAKALAIAPEDRFQSVGELLVRFNEVFAVSGTDQQTMPADTVVSLPGPTLIKPRVEPIDTLPVQALAQPLPAIAGILPPSGPARLSVRRIDLILMLALAVITGASASFLVRSPAQTAPPVEEVPRAASPPIEAHAEPVLVHQAEEREALAEPDHPAQPAHLERSPARAPTKLREPSRQEVHRAAPNASRYPALAELLQAAKENPEDGKLISRLAREILAAAEGLEEGDAKTSIKRRTASSVIAGDIAGLEASLHELESASRR